VEGEAVMNKGKIVAVVGIVVVALAAAFLLLRGRTEDVPPPAVTEATPVPEPTATPSPFSGVSLVGSDEAVRQAAGDLSENPAWVRWLAHDDLVRRFVASVNLVAKGRSPRNQLGFLRPKRPFQVVERGGAVYADPASWHRYDTVVSVVMSIDPARAAALYREIHPLLDEAYREISRPGARFDDLLARAVDHLLATPIPGGEPELERKVVTWRFADPALEGLSDAQRQLLRLGPENARKVQEWLRGFMAAIGETSKDDLPDDTTAGE